MNRTTAGLAAFALAMAAALPAAAEEREGDDDRAISIALIGDWPYNANLIDNASVLTQSVNTDRSVKLVMHIGDIHSGSMPCTSAGILPAIAKADPGWNQRVYFQFQQFEVPVVYTPGDNEWTDCHKSKQFASGAPLKELAAVRSLFFAKAGRTLGRNERDVTSQAKAYNPAYPDDAKFVENVMWQDARVVFATFNMPGSNNDGLPWTGAFSDPAAQAQEVLQRNAANSRWLQATFDRAQRTRAKAVVIGLQADMWDPAAVVAGGDGLFGYTAFVRQLADLALRFSRPVLLVNGDSHVYGADRPLADPASASGRIHGTPAVPNLQRITVQGSTNSPAEWVKLTIDTRTAAVFSWQNVVWCTNATGSCH